MNNINKAVISLIDKDQASVDEISILIESDIENLEEAANIAGDSLDYVVEKFLEYATENISDFISKADRIKKYWLYLDDVPGGTAREINIRAAEFLAAMNKHIGMDYKDLSQMVLHEDWQIRLVVAWSVRNAETDEEKKLKDLLAKDPYQDDNGFFLVREGAGHEDAQL